MKVKKKLTRGDVVRILLDTVKSAGLVTTAMVAPKVVTAMKKLGIIDIGNFNKQAITTARIRLAKNGYLRKDLKGFWKLTEAGENKLKSLELSSYELIVPKFWDGKWRVLIFDIPEYRRNVRTKVRRTLQSIGFRRLQDSVWVFPYDCSELIALLKSDFKIGKDLLYMVVDSIENDRSLKEYFNLN